MTQCRATGTKLRVVGGLLAMWWMRCKSPVPGKAAAVPSVLQYGVQAGDPSGTMRQYRWSTAAIMNIGRMDMRQTNVPVLIWDHLAFAPIYVLALVEPTLLMDA